ncbi:hypothetical protein C8R44DRAFT_91192 [Mycena epipterygia]|nr:hypothetical protein C8R44DRAFT_91192 [Mycena epipterygia]
MTSLSPTAFHDTKISWRHPGRAHQRAATKLAARVPRRCFNCCTTDTSTWRRSNLSPGKVLCNKCGLFECTHSCPRHEQFPHKRGPLASSTFRSGSPPAQQAQDEPLLCSGADEDDSLRRWTSTCVDRQGCAIDSVDSPSPDLWSVSRDRRSASSRDSRLALRVKTGGLPTSHDACKTPRLHLTTWRLHLESSVHVMSRLGVYPSARRLEG